MSRGARPRTSLATLAETLEREGNAEWAQVVREASWEREKAMQTRHQAKVVRLALTNIPHAGFDEVADTT
jgi:hypothetical protein